MSIGWAWDCVRRSRLALLALPAGICSARLETTNRSRDEPALLGTWAIKSPKRRFGRHQIGRRTTSSRTASSYPASARCQLDNHLGYHARTNALTRTARAPSSVMPAARPHPAQPRSPRAVTPTGIRRRRYQVPQAAEGTTAAMFAVAAHSGGHDGGVR
jgi:hypothetical protein